MLHRLTMRMTALLMGCLATAALLVAVPPAAAKDPLRPGALDESIAILGTWKTLDTDKHGAFQPLGLLLDENNRFRLIVADAHGEVVDKVEGHYTFAAGVLTLLLDGKAEPYAVMQVEFADDALDLHAGGKKTHWVKDMNVAGRD